MRIYDEITMVELDSIDEENGYTYNGQYQIGVESERLETVPGTMTDEFPNGLHRLIPSRPIYEECLYYHKFTNEELIEKYEQQLRAMDYIGVKIATGRATKEEYTEQISRMTELAMKIRQLSKK